MRLAYGFVVALWLILAVPATPRQQPDQSTLPKAAGQASPPANQQTSAEPKASDNSLEEKPTISASGTQNANGKRRKRPSTSATGLKPGDPPRKIVVREGGAKEPSAQIEPDITPAEAKRERQNAEQLLESSDGQLKQLASRTLNAQQQETVEQIHNYMDGARSALKEGDVRRAGTLAEKAHLLADDLVKH
jgi:hypothetical protein